jgi:hypothetical protein
MTATGPEFDVNLPAWNYRFPDRRLWAARLRLWRVELPVRAPSVLGEWIRKATADGTTPTEAVRRLGLPASVLRTADRPGRRTFAFLDAPGGAYPVEDPPVAFALWPEPITAVPPHILRPAGVDVVPLSNDWRTVPIVRAEIADVVAVESGELIEVFAADDRGGPPLWQLTADAWRAR